MNIGQSISSVFRQYFVFSGRACRSEYWWFALFHIIAIFALAFTIPSLFVIYFLATIIPTLAVLVRRLHDTGRAAWWLLLPIIPFGNIVLLVFTVMKGEQRENRYGPDPLRSSPDEIFTGSGENRISVVNANICTDCSSELEPGSNFCRS